MKFFLTLHSPPPPQALLSLHLQSSRVKTKVETRASKTMSGAVLQNVEASFSGPALGNLAERHTHTLRVRQPASRPGWASKQFNYPATFPAKNNFFQGGYRGKVTSILSFGHQRLLKYHTERN